MRRPDHRQRAPTLATHGKLQEPVSHHKRIFPLQLPLGYIPLPLLTPNAYTGRPPELVPCSCTAAFLVHLSDHSTKCPQLLFSCSKNLACPAHKAARSPHVLQRKAAPKPWKSTTEETEAGQQRVILLTAFLVASARNSPAEPGKFGIWLGLVTITSRWDQQAPFVPWPVALPGQTSSRGPAVTPWGQNKVQGTLLLVSPCAQPGSSRKDPKYTRGRER